ncbi:hypothetical protein Cpir12675_001824 [Ceratocystis pirilliformis]|uniref:Uncharacterized protein n=1 Tax=Ceratocystis pirilliformis TaxID=259994 RepID=A0ABR3ZEX5_9PEZI
MSDDPLFDIDGTERHDAYLLKKIHLPADIAPSCATDKSINTDPTASLDDNGGNNNADNFNLWIPTPSLFNMQHVVMTRRFTQGELIGIRHIIAYIDSLDWTFEATTLVLDTLLKHLPLPKYYNEFEPVRKYGWKIMNASILTAADVSDMTTPEFLCMVAFSRLPSWNIMTVLVDDLPLADRLSTMLESA